MSALPVVAILLPFLLALFGAAWWLSSMISALKVTVDSLMESVKELREGLKHLSTIPLHEQRIEQLEQLVRELISKMAVLWDKTFSLAQHAAVAGALEEERRRVQSSPDLSHFTQPTRIVAAIPRRDP